MSFNPRKNIFQSPVFQQDSKWASQWQRAGKSWQCLKEAECSCQLLGRDPQWAGTPCLPAWNPWWDFPKHFSSAYSAPVVNFTISSTGTGYRNTAKILPEFPSGDWKLLCFVPCPKKGCFMSPEPAFLGGEASCAIPCVTASEGINFQ